MKIYALMANGCFYDSHDNLKTIKGWRDDFKIKLDLGKIPHRWFGRFVKHGKMEPITMKVLEIDLETCKEIEG